MSLCFTKYWTFQVWKKWLFCCLMRIEIDLKIFCRKETVDKKRKFIFGCNESCPLEKFLLLTYSLYLCVVYSKNKKWHEYSLSSGMYNDFTIEKNRSAFKHHGKVSLLDHHRIWIKQKKRNCFRMSTIAHFFETSILRHSKCTCALNYKNRVL